MGFFSRIVSTVTRAVDRAVTFVVKNAAPSKEAPAPRKRAPERAPESASPKPPKPSKPRKPRTPRAKKPPKTTPKAPSAPPSARVEEARAALRDELGAPPSERGGEDDLDKITLKQWVAFFREYAEQLPDDFADDMATFFDEHFDDLDDGWFTTFEMDVPDGDTL